MTWNIKTNVYVQALIIVTLSESPIPLSTRQVCRRVEEKQKPGMGLARNGIRRTITDMVDSGLIRIVYEGKTNTDIELVVE